jgi:protein pelota
MEIRRFHHESGTLKLKIDNFDDLWCVQRIIFANDIVRSESMRRFRSNERDLGELKEVVVALRVEKTELDKGAQRLRIMGKIVEGRPEEYVQVNSYHTLNIGAHEEIEIMKAEWRDYMMQMLKEAVSATKKPRLGIIALDDEKALPAYLLGYGLEFLDNIYCGTSKRMKPKEFEEKQRSYFDAVVSMVTKMNTDVVVIAGPGFTKDNLKKYIEERGLAGKIGKKLVFESTSNPEKSGIYEIIRGESVSNLLSKERMRIEFRSMEEFLKGLSTGRSKHGIQDVEEAIRSYSVTSILVNDSVLGKPEVQQLLAKAEEERIKIEIFNSGDEVGVQLHAFSDIASL